MKTINFCFLLCAALLFYSFEAASFAENDGRDAGTLMVSPYEIFNSKKIGDNKILEAFTQTGTVASDNPTSPWYNSSLFSHGSILKDTNNSVLKEVVFYETIDKDGDLVWTVVWFSDGKSKEGTIEIIQGTGKWSGISGIGKINMNREPRSDGYLNPEFLIEWNIDEINPPFSDEIEDKGKYEFMDKCLSFHGPHIYLSKRELSNGITLDFSTQSGVLLSMLGFDHKSPRNGATCFDRGTTVKMNGKVLGDVMILEDTDADGDVVWLYHIWWYNKGPGIYNFIGGTGKWEGIEGVGVTRGMFKKRTDDHFMLKSELHWNLNP